MSRDAWREKHHQVQAKLEQERQLSAERGKSRDRWRNDCDQARARAEAAESLAQQRIEELERLQARCAELEAERASPKKCLPNAAWRTPARRAVPSL